MSTNGHRATPSSLTWEDFKKRRSETQHSNWIVDRLIPKPSLGIMVGDSTIGKTPLAIQMALCVSFEILFLGRATTRQTVIMADLESGPDLFEEIVEAQCRFLGLPKPSPLFRSMISNDGIETVEALEIELAITKPGLVIIDSLRFWQPGSEKDEKTAGTLFTRLKTLSRLYDCAIIIVHHPKKAKSDDEGKVVRTLLRDSSVGDWMMNAAGSRALINLTDVRIGVDAAKGKGPTGDLTLKWNIRVLGDSGTHFLDRVLDDDGNPLGYRLATGRKQLTERTQQFFDKLTREPLTFKSVKHLFGCSDSSTDYHLKQMISAGLVVHDRSLKLYRLTESLE